MTKSGPTPSLKRPPSVDRFELREARRWQWLTASCLSWTLMVVGLGFTIVLAVVAADSPTTGTVLSSVAIAVAAGLFQIISVVAGSRTRAPDPILVKVLSRRLVQLSSNVHRSLELTEEDVNRQRLGTEPQNLGEISVHLSYVQEHLAESLEAWRDLSPELFLNKRGGDD